MSEPTGAVDPDDRPRSLRNAGARERRRAMLALPHVASLTAYAAALRERERGQVPDFDPRDGGVNARVLFLFEKPGPMTSGGGGTARRGGSGFISRNNDDPTAEAICRFMEQAGIARKAAVIWNVIPWWNGTRNITGDELRAGVAEVRELIARLPRVRTVVMVGGKAAKAKPYLESTGLVLLVSQHPSPLVRAKFPDKWNAIPANWSRAREFIDVLGPEMKEDPDEASEHQTVSGGSTHGSGVKKISQL